MIDSYIALVISLHQVKPSQLQPHVQLQVEADQAAVIHFKHLAKHASTNHECHECVHPQHHTHTAAVVQQSADTTAQAHCTITRQWMLDIHTLYSKHTFRRTG
jgi:hypothetical protein